MARPKSEDKRNAILAAAIQMMAEQGLGAPTARIAKMAGVAEGTLFTYFDNKDELVNALYLSIKAELREALVPEFPRDASLRERVQHLWRRYVDWGVANPDKRKVMLVLSASDRVTEQSRAAGMQAFAEAHTLLESCTAQGHLQGHSPAFASAIMGALAETTMDFIVREPAQRDRYCDAGFNTFWNAIAHT
ncbi:TetR family transcriptional regulator [Paraburkholderia eburnea]|uniref:TetR family transcriptional regulator n=1 Tax=Paraburkholderia eburnea TaxID=1189126 RepID=A0A2S4MJ32_9BURK|nr:TetR/AcrR family transcriptional regulator [Paraburkholderia eburnea]POR54750.1 TetR family transcriptional regulator [Paraburkholderia eburnea]PRZ24650.1 TetR family transcriptional regulator [Paraburkholderia eburnea]